MKLWDVFEPVLWQQPGIGSQNISSEPWPSILYEVIFLSASPWYLSLGICGMRKLSVSSSSGACWPVSSSLHTSGGWYTIQRKQTALNPPETTKPNRFQADPGRLQLHGLFPMFCRLEELSSDAELKLTQAFVTPHSSVQVIGRDAGRPQQRGRPHEVTAVCLLGSGQKATERLWDEFMFDHRLLRPLEVSEQLQARHQRSAQFYWADFDLSERRAPLQVHPGNLY